LSGRSAPLYEPHALSDGKTLKLKAQGDDMWALFLVLPALPVVTLDGPDVRRRARRDVFSVKRTHMFRVAGTFLLLVLLTSGGSASDAWAAPDNGDPSTASAALAVSFSETPDAVLVHIRASGDVEPGSVEVRFAGHKTVVLARDAEGRAIRSQSLHLPEPVTEEGSSADYDADGALVMTLRKHATAHGAAPTDDPEAAAR